MLALWGAPWPSMQEGDAKVPRGYQLGPLHQGLCISSFPVTEGKFLYREGFAPEARSGLLGRGDRGQVLGVGPQAPAPIQAPVTWEGGRGRRWDKHGWDPPTPPCPCKGEVRRAGPALPEGLTSLGSPEGTGSKLINSPSSSAGQMAWGDAAVLGVGQSHCGHGQYSLGGGDHGREGQCRKGNSLGPGKGSGCRERESSRQGWPRVGSQARPLTWQGGAKGSLVGAGRWGSLTPVIKGGALGTLKRQFAGICDSERTPWLL